MSGYGFDLAYPTFEGYKIAQYMRSYLLTYRGEGGIPSLFYNFPYLPLLFLLFSPPAPPNVQFS